MDDEQVLIEIKKTEKKAKNIHEKAIIEKEELINEAKHTAFKLVGDTEKKAKNKADKMISDAEKRLRTKKEKMLAESYKEHDEAKKNAMKNINDATNYVSKKFLEKFE